MSTSTLSQSMVPIWHKPAIFILTISAMSAALLIPTIINGFPFVFADTATYLRAVVQFIAPQDRSIYYSFFCLFFHWTISPWPVVVVQAALVSVMICLVAKAVFDIREPLSLIAISVLLSATTSLPWFVGQIMPDIFTACLALGVILITLGWHSMQREERWFALMIIPVCVSFHYGNVAVVLLAMAGLPLIAVLGWRPEPGTGWRFAALAGGIAIGVAAIFSFNLVIRGKFVLSPTASTFLMARLLEDGSALRVLEAECPAKTYAFCSQLDALHNHQSARKIAPELDSLGDFFLWGGPIEALGGWKEVEPEAAKVVSKALAVGRWEQIQLSAKNSVKQFFSFAIGDGLIPYQKDSPTAVPDIIRVIFGNTVYQDWLDSRQARGELNFTLLNAVQIAILVGSVIVLVIAASLFRRDAPKILYAVTLTVAFLAGNAVVTGALSSVHDRYQSRVIWLVPLLAGLILVHAPRLLQAHRRLAVGIVTGTEPARRSPEFRSILTLQRPQRSSRPLPAPERCAGYGGKSDGAGR
jgi:hypothetical protein